MLAGTDKVKFYSALGYQIMEGIISPSLYNRFSGKINVKCKFNFMVENRCKFKCNSIRWFIY